MQYSYKWPHKYFVIGNCQWHSIIRDTCLSRGCELTMRHFCTSRSLHSVSNQASQLQSTSSSHIPYLAVSGTRPLFPQDGKNPNYRSGKEHVAGHTALRPVTDLTFSRWYKGTGCYCVGLKPDTVATAANGVFSYHSASIHNAHPGNGRKRSRQSCLWGRKISESSNVLIRN